MARFAGVLRAEARTAEERAAQASDAGPGVADIAERNTHGADRLRHLAESVGTMSEDELARLATMSDDEMRGFAKALRFVDPTTL